ncbi:MAG TPA: NusG domain II-containing protein [Thermoanaerobacterales bacterium]|nr:NusG domain II-containing protein [Thermoanaerobacterales bacterium]
MSMIRLKKGDKILILSIFIFCFFIFVLGGTFIYGAFETKYVIIEASGVEVNRFVLGPDTKAEKVEVKGIAGYSIVEIGKDKVRMYYSPCDNKDCLKVSWISKPGQMIVCLPNQIAVKIVGAKTVVDDTTY